MTLAVVIGAFMLGYGLGSVPFGLLVTGLAGTVDPRTIGSHNIGATNVLRTGRKDLAAATLLLDMLKGTAGVLVAAALGPVAMLAAAVGAFLGHIYPVWLRFRGGKGVATYVGVCLGIDWRVALLFGAVWIGVAFATRYSSAAAVAAALAVPLAFALLGHGLESGVFGAMTVLLLVKHRQNIARLLAGKETKIGSVA